MVAISPSVSVRSARSDEDLFVQTVGDPGSFDILIDRYQNRLFSFVFRFVGDLETAEDIVQETFLRVLRRARTGYPLSSFSTWVFTIASNLARSELRRRKRWRRYPSEPSEGDGEGQTLDLMDESVGPDALAEGRIMEAAIHEAIQTLPIQYRESVILRDVEGLSYQEIAEVTHLPAGTVKSRVNRGRLRLQGRLRAMGFQI